MIPDANFTLDGAKNHLRIVHTEEDAVIVAMLDAAVALCERYTARAWTERAWSTPLDACDLEGCGCTDPAVYHALLSPAVPVIYAGDVALDASAYYTGTMFGHTIAVITEASAFGADPRGTVGRIDWEAGPPNEQVPPDVIAAAMLYLGDLFENREAQIVGTIVARNALADALLRPYVLDLYM